ncbi:MAG: Gfo/Idh/MocA family oxidoreductase [Phycisphaerales bacterium]
MKSSQSRRSFMMQAAAAGAAAAILGSTAEASVAPRFKATRSKVKVKPPASGQTIRMGVIGTGGMGTGHCYSTCDQAKRGDEDVQIVALADVNQVRMGETARGIKDRQGTEPDQYVDYRQLLARDDIHCVLIASPEHWHAQHAIDALQAGKDVYCEKPMTLRLQQALELRSVVKANPDRIFQVGTQKMMLPKYLAARDVINAGTIGKPVFSQTSYCRNTPSGEWNYYGLDDRWQPGVNVDWKGWQGYLYRPDRAWDPKVYARWRRYSEFSTGIVGDLLVHEITPLLMALENQVGWPTRVVASGGHYIDKDMDNHDQVNLNVQFEGEHTMIVAGSTCNEVGLENMIRGNKGNIYLNSRHCEVRPTRPYVDEVDQQTIECQDIGNDQEKLRLNWFQCIRSREPAISNVDHATKVMVIVDLATRSMWEGSAFEYDEKTMTVRKL